MLRDYSPCHTKGPGKVQKELLFLTANTGQEFSKYCFLYWICISTLFIPLFLDQFYSLFWSQQIYHFFLKDLIDLESLWTRWIALLCSHYTYMYSMAAHNTLSDNHLASGLSLPPKYKVHEGRNQVNFTYYDSHRPGLRHWVGIA